MNLRLPDSYELYGEEKKLLLSQSLPSPSAEVCMAIESDTLSVDLIAHDEPICYLVFRWRFTADEQRQESVRVLGDAWERAYGELEWRGIAPDRWMPWYFLVSNGSDSNTDYQGRRTEGFGVKVRPSALCIWQYDKGGMTLCLDLRCGAKGVILNGRKLRAAEVIFGEFKDCSAYEAGKRFCHMMCKDPVLPKQPVYGFNNWYYAYGKSSAEAILNDTKRLAHYTAGLSNPPYMVIDDGWQPNLTDGPWHRGHPTLFPDMKKLAAEIRAMNAIPGIWVRPWVQKADYPLPTHWRLDRNNQYLDPSEPEVLQYVEETVRRIVEWGYGLIKFDYVTYDFFGEWGNEKPSHIVKGAALLAKGKKDWSFHDRSKTSAEILVTLYQRIREAAGDAILIGCNAIGHLCAGLVELNRTGDDTSGKDWHRTRTMGVNTLAFRSIQNGSFYMADADCVGLTANVPWSLNKKWTEYLAASGSPLFISWDAKQATEDVCQSVKSALARGSVQNDELIPLDWMENTCPARWLLNGKEQTVDWFENWIDLPF